MLIMPMDLLLTNLYSPIVLAFLVGVFATLIKSELEFPEPVLRAISIYLLLSISLKGGHELAQVEISKLTKPMLATFFLVFLLPTSAYLIARKIGGMNIPNAGGVAALYGSVSTVTFFAAISFARSMDTPAEPFLPAMAAFMEWAIIVALFIARWRLNREEKNHASMRRIFMETLRGRGFVLLSGGLLIGATITEEQYKQISPFYDQMFRGILMLFLLEMGMTAARQLKDFFQVGFFMIAYAILVPILHGAIGVTLGTMAGLSVGGAFVFGTLAASASYIDAPAAVRAALPQANPSIYLTASLGVTFPFNLLVGLPLYYKMAAWAPMLLGH
jgi:uncharacterized protein